jgi:chromosome segregation ATPase
MKVAYAQSMLLSKALRMQQDLEDKKHEVIIEGLENKIKDHAAALEKKDFELQTIEGLPAEAEAKIARLNSELLSKSENFEQEKQKFDTKFEAEVEKSSNLQKSLKELQDRCLEFGNRCVHRLKQVFNSVVNRPNFSLPPADLIDIPSLARSIGNRFIMQI